MRIAYARTSRDDQRLDLQLDAFKNAGIEEDYIYKEQLSALSKRRPQLELALKRCRAGDTLVVWKLDRLGRSVSQLIETVNDLKKREVDFISLTEGFDTSTPMGTLIFHIMAALAQMERDQTAERTAAGIAAAKERKTYTTRSLSFTREQWNKAVGLWHDNKAATITYIAKKSGLKYNVVHKNQADLRAGADFDTRFPFEKNRGKAQENK